MLSRLFQQLIASCGVVFRTFRAFFSRQIDAVIARFKSATSLTRQASKLAPAMMKTAANAGKKPTRREDYIETNQLFISKSFVIMAVVMVVAVLLLFFLVIWPWLVSMFFTAKMWYEDPDVAGYTGKVILYYEETKDTIRFEGRLEDGIIQGEGRFYDENGLLVYRGNYEDGVYSGAGTLYDQGILVYEGAFADGLYNGEGVLYSESGSALYKGGFVNGLYSGAGTLTVSDRVTIEASFEAGTVMGIARCLDQGTLYYEGELKDLAPEGEGTFYSATGAVLYVGPVKNGTVDGAALLGATADEIRGMLGDKGKEKTREQGFTITSEALGLTVFCSFAQDGEDPLVYHVYLYGPEKDTIPGLIWPTTAEYERLALIDEEPPGQSSGYMAAPNFAAEVPVPLGSNAFCQFYNYGEYALRLWSKSQDGAVLVSDWRLNRSLPGGAETPDASAGSAGRLAGLMEQLGLAADEAAAGAAEKNPYYGQADAGTLLEGTDPTQRSALADAMQTYFEYAERRIADEENLALYQRLLEEAKKQVETAQGDPLQVSRMEDTIARLELQISRDMVQMQKAARAVEDATGQKAEMYDLQSLIPLFDVGKMDAGALGVAVLGTAMEKARLAAEEAAGLEAEQSPPPAETVPPAQEGEGLPPAETGGQEGGETVLDPLPDPEEPEKPEHQVVIDTQAILRDMESDVLELALVYQTVELATAEYRTALEALARAAERQAMGTAAMSAKTEAQITVNEKRAALYTALADFARQTTALNEASGGWLAKEINWLPKSMGTLLAETEEET